MNNTYVQITLQKQDEIFTIGTTLETNEINKIKNMYLKKGYVIKDMDVI